MSYDVMSGDCILGEEIGIYGGIQVVMVLGQDERIEWKEMQTEICTQQT